MQAYLILLFAVLGLGEGHSSLENSQNQDSDAASMGRDVSTAAEVPGL